MLTMLSPVCIQCYLINSHEELVQEIDKIRQSIGVDRAALIKVWLHERVQKEKAGSFGR